MAQPDETPASIDELEFSMEMVSGDAGFDMQIYISKKTGALVQDAEAFTGEPCPVEDIEYDPDYVLIPGKFELDLGQNLVWQFVRQTIPDLERDVRHIFSRRGAYRRYKKFLESRGLLEAWHAFENNCTRQALLEWCRDHQIPIRHEAPDLEVLEAPALFDPARITMVNELIRTRRSIKPAEMSEAPLDRTLLDAILENANWAPTHGRTEPWRFKVYTGESRRRLAETLQDVYKATTPEVEFRAEKFEKLGKNPLLAPVVIVVWMQRQASAVIPEIEEIESVACAVQNMHLTASATGLGAFWSSPPVVYRAKLREALGLGPEDRCLGLFYLGWPKKVDEWPEGRRKPIEQKVEWLQ